MGELRHHFPCSVNYLFAAAAYKRLAVDTLTYGGVLLVSTDFYGVESAVIGFAMVGALGNGALNSSVGFHIRHFASSFHDEKEFRDLLNPGIIISVRHAFDSCFHRFFKSHTESAL